MCRHPDNEALLALKEPVNSSADAIVAFRSISSDASVRDWPADQLVDLIATPHLSEWAAWMRTRYFARI